MEIAVYDSIEDLPIWNWNKIHQKSDFTFLCVNRINGQKTKEENKFLTKLWEKIFSEYIDRFGFSEDLLRIHAKKKEIALLKAQKMISGDLSINTFIELAQKELTGMGNAQKNGGDFWQSKASIEEILKFQIDAKKTSVVEFYSYVENIKRKCQKK